MQVNNKLDKQDSKLDSNFIKHDTKLDQILGIVTQSEIQAPVWTHAMIPPEVPELPDTLQTRPALMAGMKERVLGQAGGTTAVVGSRGELQQRLLTGWGASARRQWQPI